MTTNEDLVAEARERAGYMALLADLTKNQPGAVRAREEADRMTRFADALEEATRERDAALAAIERVKETLSLHNPNGRLVKEALAALDGAPEPEWEREYRRVRPDGVPVFNAVFETMPLLDDYYTAEYRTVSPWLPVEGESKP